ncbi:MAG: GTPase domain-containing protein [Holophagales bacterium]|nr:GTPase domain-containing protein [Holophagales bacterium]
MACLDPATGQLVVRLIYDGPARSGKTTTVLALAEDLGRTVEDPEAYRGRTLFFDRFEYSGGRFDGRPIRCEVLSIPGQPELFARRSELLAGADAVVFVVDSSRHRLRQNLESLMGLEQVIEQLGAPQIPVLLQLNKRDVEDVVSTDELTAWFDHLPIQLSRESVAIEGKGVREMFVLAVGAAAARARKLEALATCREARSAEQLRHRLEELVSHEGLELDP